MKPTAAVSRTSLSSAVARAAHLIVDDEPVIFADPLAVMLLGEDGAEILGYHRRFPTSAVLAGARTEAACRSRFAEDRLTGSGLTQYVILGAGLDTYAYRTDLAEGTSVFEVDRPQSQEAKRAALRAAGIAVPSNVTYVPIDFETDQLIDALSRSGFDAARPAFVSWLGVTMYLTRQSLAATMAAVGRLPPGTQLVADYLLAPHLRDADGHAYAAAVGQAAAAGGEPWVSSYPPEELTGILTRHGFSTITHVRQAETLEHRAWTRTDALHPMEFSALVHATV
ncbi:MAG: class I SAM-dependent methyltransferase [Cellulomonas sp.]|nr:class I SAM-dependent methyltransferase [Cellulomonas sp.]